MIAGTVVFHVAVLVYLAGLLKWLALIVEHLHTMIGTTSLIVITVFIIISIYTIEAFFLGLMRNLFDEIPNTNETK